MATNKRHPRAKPGGGSSSAAIREEILREWRGADEAADLNAGIHRADQFLAAILRSAGLQDGIQEDELRAAWKELAGDFIARHTEPSSVKGGHLVLRVTQPAMRFHLEQMKPMLLSRIREQLGENRIFSVKFTLG
jgi:predicted nucleic acid-binding Zn ribbon protein